MVLALHSGQLCGPGQVGTLFPLDLSFSIYKVKSSQEASPKEPPVPFCYPEMSQPPSAPGKGAVGTGCVLMGPSPRARWPPASHTRQPPGYQGYQDAQRRWAPLQALVMGLVGVESGGSDSCAQALPAGRGEQSEGWGREWGWLGGQSRMRLKAPGLYKWILLKRKFPPIPEMSLAVRPGLVGLWQLGTWTGTKAKVRKPLRALRPTRPPRPLHSPPTQVLWLLGDLHSPGAFAYSSRFSLGHFMPLTPPHLTPPPPTRPPRPFSPLAAASTLHLAGT